MTVVVAYKWAANPQDARVGEDGSIDWSRAKPAISEYDPVAIQVARQLADATDSELVGVSVGTSAVGTPMARKAAMSRGMDRGLIVSDDAVASWNLTQTGEAVAALVQRVPGADLLITGESSVDEAAKMVPAIAAGYLGWPSFQHVTAVERTADGWAVTQVVAGGTRTVRVTGPVVVSTSSDAVVPKVPGMKDIMAAGKKTVDVVTVAELALTAEALEATDRRKPEKATRRNKIFTGENAAAELVAELRAEGVL